MKIQTSLMAVLAATTIIFTGCDKSGSEATRDNGTSAAAVSVDTSKLETVFASADAATKSAVDSAVMAVKNADYSGAAAQLKSLGEKFKLTDEQQAAVKEVVEKVKNAITAAASKTAGDASKAAGDLSKSLGK